MTSQNRMKSHRGTRFRIWATQRLREYIIKGFTLDDVLLKQAGGRNYLNPEAMRVIFKDSGFKDDVVKTNAVQILRQAGIDDVKSL